MDGQAFSASNQEIASPHHEARFIGSSSGVYFINTVRRAFADSAQPASTTQLPDAEDTVGGEEDFTPRTSDAGNGIYHTVQTEGKLQINIVTHLGTLPSYGVARSLAVEYFKLWHPVLPFLSGPAFLENLETIYRDRDRLSGPDPLPLTRQRTCRLIILHCVTSMGAACTLSGEEKNRPLAAGASDLLGLVAPLATHHDLLTIQTVLAAQLYCVSTMALRTASSLSGLATKLLFHAGLHRCPHRYRMSEDQRDLRKRIFWSAYVLDKYLCQVLGLPLGLNDSDLDVCVSGRPEQHGTEMTMIDRDLASKELVLANFAEYARLLGRALELFHKSIHSRRTNARDVMFLRADVDQWYNSLPDARSSPDSRGSAADTSLPAFVPFFHVLYEQLLITLHRPSLSKSQTSPEFHNGLQTTIRAAKRTIAQLELEERLFWPGYLAAVWMSGLVLSFASQIGLYDIAQGSQEITRCLAVLQRMKTRWPTAGRCYAVLATLLENLRRDGPRTPHRVSLASAVDTAPLPKKRARLDSDAVDDRPLPEAPPTVHPATAANDLDAQAAVGPGQWDTADQWSFDDLFQDISWDNLFGEGGGWPDGAGQL